MDSLSQSMRETFPEDSDRGAMNWVPTTEIIPPKVEAQSITSLQQISIAEDIFVGGGEMGKLMRSLDWSQTPLGLVAYWPQSLRTSVSICLASHFPMLIWWGTELVMLYNDAYRPILGATKHPKAMGQRGRECWPEIWDIIGPMLEGVLIRGEATWSENQLLILDRNGYLEECYFTFSYSPIRDETGGIGGIFTAVTETTQQVVGERRLRTLHDLTERTTKAKTSEEVCHSAIATLSGNTDDIPFALLYMLEHEGKQARLVDMFGLMPDIAASSSFIDVSQAQDSFGQWPLEQVIQTGRSELVEHLNEHFGNLSLSDGIIPPHSALVLPIAKPTQQDPYGILVVGISAMRKLDDDYRNFLTLTAGEIAAAITNARAFQAERERAESLAELDAAKTAFFSNVSHEFRTPLTLLLGPVEDALADTRNPLSPEQRERLEIVRRNSLRLLKLVNTLLDFSRMEAGRAQATYEPTDLAAFTRELASVFRSAVEKAGLRLVVDCLPLSEPVYIDRHMWEKIVLNLLSNALKFTFEGQITVALHTVEDHVELEVHDTGIGIPPEEIPHLFERFYRVHGTRARTYEGSGIGLSLVQELVQLHGGSVQVASRVGEGTTFTVTIPSGSTHLPAERIGTARMLQSTALGAAPYVEEALRWLPDTAHHADETEDQSKKQTLESSELPADKIGTVPVSTTSAARILLADDNADMRDYLKRLLSEFWTVEAVPDGAAALAAIRERIPDIVLSDVMMPGLDGFQLLQALRSEPRTRTVPVLLLSARAGEAAAIEGLKAGADDYLVKPFSARELIARVGAHLEMARIRQEIIRARDELFSIISHDLKNPLSTIKGYAQLLRRVAQRSGLKNTEQLVDGLTRIDTTATRMTALINELLDIAYIQIGRPLELDLNEIDLVALAHQTVLAYQQTTEQHQFRVEAHVPELVGEWDESRLERVLGNLLSNAIKYSPNGGKIMLELGQERKENRSWAVLSIQDQGMGIPAADLPYVFDRFHRAGNVTGHIRGTGIGLASARQIVEQLGGTITVTSEEGLGTTFTVRLPLKSETDK